MPLPTLHSRIRRRLLVNFRSSPEVARALLPAHLEPKLVRGHAVVGMCLLRLEGLPLGLASENVAHRMAVEWKAPDGSRREGVYVWRRDTDSRLVTMSGRWVFPAEHHLARFDVEHERDRLSIGIRSRDGRVRIDVAGRETDEVAADSCFGSLEEASAFFEAGKLGVSPGEPRAVVLEIRNWRLTPFALTTATSTLLPPGIQLDSAFLMRDVTATWHTVQAPDGNS